MREYSDCTFSMIRGRSKAEISGFRLKNCTIDNCSVSRPKDLSDISRISDVVLENCRVNVCHVSPAIFEEVVVKNLRIDGILIFWAPLFSRVKLAGRIGTFKVNYDAEPLASPEYMAKFDELRADFYEGAEYALDISEAQFTDFDCLGVPVDLIRRDPLSQVIVRKNNIKSADVLKGDFEEKYPDVFMRLESFFASPHNEQVLVTPVKRPAARRKNIQEGLMLLREFGIADAD
jgi:hypothetical protein